MFVNLLDEHARSTHESLYCSERIEAVSAKITTVIAEAYLSGRPTAG